MLKQNLKLKEKCVIIIIRAYNCVVIIVSDYNWVRFFAPLHGKSPQNEENGYI